MRRLYRWACLAMGMGLAPLAVVPVLQAPAGAATHAVTRTPGTTWGAFSPCSSNASQNCATVYAVAFSSNGSTVYIGGSFTKLISPSGTQSVSCNNLAAIKESTGLPDTTFKCPTGWNGPVFSLAVANGRVYAGGKFTRVAGRAGGNLAAFNGSTGAVDTSFTGTTSAGVYTISPTQGGADLYLGGAFAKVDGWHSQPMAAEVNATTGSFVSTFAPRIAYSGSKSPCPSHYACSGSVHTFFAGSNASGNSTLYIGGQFTSIGGKPRYTIGAVNPTTGAVTPFTAPVKPSGASSDPPADQWVSQIIQSGQALYVGQAGPDQFLYRYNLSGTMQWSDAPSGDVQTIALSPDGSQVYVGGHFNCWCSGSNRPPQSKTTNMHLARVSTSGSLDTSWDLFYQPWASPDYYGVWALGFDPANGDLWVGGEGLYIQPYGTSTKYQAPKVAVFR